MKQHTILNLLKRRSNIYTLCLLAVLSLAACGGGGGESGTTATTSEMYSLSVSKFGQGDIKSSAGNVACSGQKCEGNYAKDSITQITATPAVGWKFSHWKGCESANLNTCTVTMNKNTLLQPYFENTATPIISSEVIVLTSTTLAELLSIDSETLIFSNSALQLKTVKNGDIIISSKGNGFARRVNNILSLTGSNYVIESSTVKLEEIIKEGTLISKQNSIPSLATSMHLEEGVTLSKNRYFDATSTNLALDIPIKNSVGKQIAKISGNMQLQWNPEIAMDFGFWDGFREAKLIINPSIKTDVIVGADAISIDEDDTEKIIPIGNFKITPILIQIGVVPVVIVPTVAAYYRYSATAGLQVNFTSSYTVQGSLGAHYVKGQGWDGIGYIGASGTFKPEGTLNIEGKIGVGTVMTFSVYDVLGPFIRVGPYIKTKGEINLTSAPTLCASFTADLGASASVGGKLNVFGLIENVKFDIDIFDKIISNLIQYSSPSCNDKIAPEAPTNLSATVENNNSIYLSWKAAVDNVKVKNYLIYRENILIGQTDSINFVDKSLKNNTQYCYKIIATDDAGNKSTFSNNACALTKIADTSPPSIPTQLAATTATTTSISLAWIASTDNSSTVSYVVLAQNNYSYITDKNSATILKLQPNTEYCFSVQAIDLSGNKSAKSNTVCKKTLPATQAAWSMLLACQNRSTLFTKDVDINADIQSNVNVNGSAIDYSGGAMIYNINGIYNPLTKILNAKIFWTFPNTTSTRIDSFTANLSTTDTGLINMVKETVYGDCYTTIRFIKK